uniref:Solute carrier family 22 member 11 n=1 Tax=Catagonus wagneri TaxID=51154 RepID=A0A8C3XB19_9CETA
MVLLVLTALLAAASMSFLVLVENFSAAVPGHRCWVRLLDNGSEVPANLTAEALLAVSIPPGPNHRPHQCLRFRQPQWQLLDPNATATNLSEAATEPCVDGWVYDRSTFTSTIVTEGLKPLGQSVFLAGTVVGSIILGFLSQRFGRKPILSWCCLQMAVTTISTIVAPNFLVYCGLRFLTSVGLSGLLLTATMLRESLDRPMALGAVAFTVRDWRVLQLIVSVLFFVIFLISWWLPESARWLIIRGKLDQALRELKKVAKINGHKEAKRTLTIEVLMSNMQEEVTSATSRYSVLDLFREPMLRWRTCRIFCFTLSYYGIVLDLQNLGRDIFLLQVFFGAMDFLAGVAITFLFRFFGRRTILASALVLAGLAILANRLIPQGATLRVALAVLGKACCATSVTCIILYRAELFPTTMRMTAEGFLLSASELGSAMSPLIRMTHQVLPSLPFLVYAALFIVSSLIVPFLPETRGLLGSDSFPLCPTGNSCLIFITTLPGGGHYYPH